MVTMADLRGYIAMRGRAGCSVRLVKPLDILGRAMARAMNETGQARADLLRAHHSGSGDDVLRAMGDGERAVRGLRMAVTRFDQYTDQETRA